MELFVLLLMLLLLTFKPRHIFALHKTNFQLKWWQLFLFSIQVSWSFISSNVLYYCSVLSKTEFGHLKSNPIILNCWFSRLIFLFITANISKSPKVSCIRPQMSRDWTCVCFEGFALTTRPSLARHHFLCLMVKCCKDHFKYISCCIKTKDIVKLNSFYVLAFVDSCCCSLYCPEVAYKLGWILVNLLFALVERKLTHL